MEISNKQRVTNLAPVSLLENLGASQISAKENQSYLANLKIGPATERKQTSLAERKAGASSSFKELVSEGIDTGHNIDVSFGNLPEWKVFTLNGADALIKELKPFLLDIIFRGTSRPLTGCSYRNQGQLAQATHASYILSFIKYLGKDRAIAQEYWFEAAQKLLKASNLSYENKLIEVLRPLSSHLIHWSKQGSLSFEIWEQVFEMVPEYYTRGIQEIIKVLQWTTLHHHPYLFPEYQTLEARAEVINRFLNKISQRISDYKEAGIHYDFNDNEEAAIYCDFTLKNQYPKATEYYYTLLQSSFANQVGSPLAAIPYFVHRQAKYDMTYGSYLLYTGQIESIEKSTLLQNALTLLCEGEPTQEDRCFFSKHIAMLNTLRKGDASDRTVLQYYDGILAIERPCFLTNFFTSAKWGPADLVISPLLEMAFFIAPTRTELARQLFQKLYDAFPGDPAPEDALLDFSQEPISEKLGHFTIEDFKIENSKPDLKQKLTFYD